MREYKDLIKESRAHLKYSLSELSKMCGLSISYISDIEHGRRIPWKLELYKALKIKQESAKLCYEYSKLLKVLNHFIIIDYNDLDKIKQVISKRWG